MFMHTKNGTVHLKDDTMYYIRFGSGSKTLIMALMYRAYAKEYTVYMFSRRNHLPDGYSTKEMAHDLKEAMDALNIEKADFIGISMGGMIAQHFAADYPDRVGKLVLAVTSAEPNPILTESVSEWIELAKSGNHTALMDGNVRRMYSTTYYQRNRWLIPIMGKLTKPKSYNRFFIQADACRSHSCHRRCKRPDTWRRCLPCTRCRYPQCNA